MENTMKQLPFWQGKYERVNVKKTLIPATYLALFGILITIALKFVGF